MRFVATDGSNVLKVAYQGDAGIDLRASEDVFVPQGVPTLVKTGMFIDPDAPRNDSEVGLVCSRSGLALEYGVFVLNAPGVIDSGYRGEICVILACLKPEGYQVKKFDRVAQLLVVNVQTVENLSDNVPETVLPERGSGGFGSSGR